MTKKQYYEYLKTDKWEAVRRAVMKRDGYSCRLCNSSIDLVAHHRTYKNVGNELNHLDDVTCLCKRCHEHFHCVTKIKLEFEQPPKKAKRKKKQKAQPEPKPQPVRKHKNGGLNYQQQSPIEIPTEDPIILTKENVNMLRTDAGGFTGATKGYFQDFGVNLQISGWINRLTGKEMTRENYIKAADARNYFR